MKKTLIALMALAGVAFGIGENGASLNSTLEEEIAKTTYVTGDSFVLTLDVYNLNSQGDTIYFMKLSDDLYIVCQNDSFVGLNSSATDPGKWYIPNNGLSGTTYTVNSNANMEYGWIYGSTNIKMGANDNAEYNAGVDLVITYDATKNTSIVEYTHNGVANKVTFTDYELDANDFAFNSDRTYLRGSIVSFTTTPASVPEPATATLSLLALAGLCARRRRA